MYKASGTGAGMSAGAADHGSAAHLDVKASVHEDGLVLLHAGRGRVFSANRVGAHIWRGLTEGQSPELVAAAISREFEVPAERAHEDTIAFVAQLERAGLL